MKIKKFMEMKDEIEKKQKAQEEKEALDRVLAEQAQTKKRQKLSTTKDKQMPENDNKGDDGGSAEQSGDSESSDGDGSSSSYSSDEDDSSDEEADGDKKMNKAKKRSKGDDGSADHGSSSSSSESDEERSKQRQAEKALKRAEAVKDLELQILQKNREIYMGMPKAKDDVFNFELTYEVLDQHTVVERIVRPWVAKKIKEYLGVEEEAMIRLVINHVANRNSAQALFDKVAPILDDVAENFVLKLWQVILFEHEKI